MNFSCPQSMAFEKKSDNNGIYMKHLAAHLKENISVEDLLHKVGAGLYHNFTFFEKLPLFKNLLTLPLLDFFVCYSLSLTSHLHWYQIVQILWLILLIKKLISMLWVKQRSMVRDAQGSIFTRLNVVTYNVILTFIRCRRCPVAVKIFGNGQFRRQQLQRYLSFTLCSHVAVAVTLCFGNSLL